MASDMFSVINGSFENLVSRLLQGDVLPFKENRYEFHSINCKISFCMFLETSQKAVDWGFVNRLHPFTNPYFS
jgi:hypothetical protein